MDILTISITDTGKVTGLGRTKIYELLATNRLKRVKIGRRTLVEVGSIRALIDGATALE